MVFWIYSWRISIYHNNGDGTFMRITNGVVVTNVADAYACAWGDYDNDGFLDLFVSNRNLNGSNPTVVNFLYHNNGDGTFARVTTGSPANEYSDSWGCSWADYDNDGFLDLFVAAGNGRGNYLYRNNGNSNSWLTVKLVGTVSNRSAIGAKVRVKATIGWVGYNELRANFGFGDATKIDIVRIEWPSGIVQTMTNVAPKQFLTVVEHQEGGTGSPNFRSVSHSANGAVELSVVGDAGLRYLLEASADFINWTWLGVRTNLTGSIQFTDMTAPNFPKRFYRVVAP